MISHKHDALIEHICPPLHQDLVSGLLAEYISMEKRYILRDWEPATLDGGQFAEILARIIYHIDSGNLSLKKSVSDCLKYIEDKNSQLTHRYPDRKSSLHSMRVIRSIYKFRSDRGAIHIDPDYTANHLDSKLVLDNSRWLLSELLRVFWSGNQSIVASKIRELIQFQIPAIGEFQGVRMVQRTDCTIDEEILILLHYAGDDGFSRKELGESVSGSSGGISNSLKKLSSKKVKNVVKIKNGNFRLTDIGIKRVMGNLPDKLIV